jgi:hypothetical protein
MPRNMLVVRLSLHSPVPRTMLVVHLVMCSSMLRAYLVVLLVGLFALMPRIHIILMGGSLWNLSGWLQSMWKQFVQKFGESSNAFISRTFPNFKRHVIWSNFLVINHPFQCLFHLLFLNLKIVVIFSIILCDV